MSVAVDATGTETHTNSNTSVNYTGITVGAGLTNGALVICVCWGTNIASPASRSVIWDNGGTNQTMTEIIFAGNVNQFVGIYGLVAPTAGNKTCAITWTNAAESYVAGQSYSGVNQAGGATSFPNSNSGTNVATIAITSATGDIVIGGLANNTANIGTLTGTTIFLDNVNGTITNAAEEYYSGAATINFGVSSGTNPKILVATDVAAAAAGGLFLPAEPLTGLRVGGPFFGNPIG